MEIIVLLKQVPATESEIRIAGDGVSIETEDIKWVVNPYDEFAVEEALRIKEAHGGNITILTVGPERATDAIRSALAMGADKGILIKDDGVNEHNSLRTARIIAGVLKKLSFDVIIAGQRAVDGDNYQVGPAVAEILKIPMMAMVTKETILDGKITCNRSSEGGSGVLEAKLPVLFTTQRGLNEPRYASLPGIMKAKKKPLEVKTPEAFGMNEADLESPQVKILSLHLPPERKAGKIIEGDTPEAKAAELVRLLREEAKAI